MAAGWAGILTAMKTIAKPVLSAHFRDRQPSAIRVASIKFAERKDGTEAINVAIGNVSLPMHPAMTARMHGLAKPESPFKDGVVKYTGTVGTDECREAFLKIIASSGCPTDGLHVQVCDGGSQAMELIILGVCGPAGSTERPLMLIDAAYTNYVAFASRVGRATCSVTRKLLPSGKFELPSMEDLEVAISTHKPGALVIIPYDNPTGHFYDQETIDNLARLAVKHNLWLISDEAYRELFYTGGPTSSVWNVTEERVPGITGRRISIETASKVWNACGLRIGAMVTDNHEFHVQSVAENTANLCSSAIGQYIFGALAQQAPTELTRWYDQQRAYYKGMLEHFTERTRELLPGVIVSSPDAALYSVVDMRQVNPDFDAMDFVLFCATKGSVEQQGRKLTLLTAPMEGFYAATDGVNPGKTQMRVAYVEPPERMRQVPMLLTALVHQYLQGR